MKYLLSVLLLFFCLFCNAKNDSIIKQNMAIDTIIMIDTSYVIDTIIKIDTSFIRQSNIQNDTIVLDSANQSWSRIPQDSIKNDFFIRKDSGQLLLSAKIGFAEKSNTKDWKGYSINSIPPLAIQAEYFQNNLWSYGGQLLYSRNKFQNDTLNTTYFKDNNFGIAAIGTFHYGTWLQDITNNWFVMGYLDLYFSLAARIDIYRNTDAGIWNESLGQFEANVIKKDVNTKFQLRPIFGIRYYISDLFALNIEIGKGNLGLLSTSVSWSIPYQKFK